MLSPQNPGLEMMFYRVPADKDGHLTRLFNSGIVSRPKEGVRPLDPRMAGGVATEVSVAMDTLIEAHPDILNVITQVLNGLNRYRFVLLADRMRQIKDLEAVAVCTTNEKLARFLRHLADGAHAAFNTFGKHAALVIF